MGQVVYLQCMVDLCRGKGADVLSKPIAVLQRDGCGLPDAKNLNVGGQRDGRHDLVWAELRSDEGGSGHEVELPGLHEVAPRGDELSEDCEDNDDEEHPSHRLQDGR